MTLKLKLQLAISAAVLVTALVVAGYAVGSLRSQAAAFRWCLVSAGGEDRVASGVPIKEGASVVRIRSGFVVVSLLAMPLLSCIHGSAGRTASKPGRGTVLRSEAAWVPSRSGGVPIQFERNIGQTDPGVRYLARGSGYRLFLTAEGYVLALRGGGSTTVVRARLVDAARDPVVVGAGRTRSLAPTAPPTDADWSSVGRNDPCPCGSGRKFKKCHGATL